jgi:flagellar FliL protein
MADEDNEVEGKKKRPILKILLIVLLVIILLAGAVGGTLFATGFFDKKDEQAAEQKLKDLEQEKSNAAAGKDKDGKPLEPQKVTKATPELKRFENHYLELERDMLANLTNSRKVIQVQVAIMTHYDERVFKNVKKHEVALRSAALDVMRQTTEADLAQKDFRKQLAEKIRTEVNAVLEKYEDFGGIEEVYFTSFVVQ